MKILETLNYHIQGLGFTDTTDMMTSTFHTDKSWTAITIVSSVLGSLAYFIEQYVGLTVTAYIAFLTLLILEFITGIRASLKSGKKIESRKFGRMIVKIGLYTTILGIIHVMKGAIASSFDIYDWVYYVVFNMVVIQLIISVLENLSKLGFAESKGIIGIIKKRLSKWFDLEEPKDHD